MRKLFLFWGAIGVLLLSSCNNEDLPTEFQKDNRIQAGVTKKSEKEDDLATFAGILSKATYARKDVREFLKTESLKQFDKNYDALYYLIKDENIGRETFRDILISYSSKETIEMIEENLPLLNILIPEITIFDVKPENLNTEDKEIPVVVSKKSETTLFLNGKEELNLEKGLVPDFHVFVVNENSRVIVPEKGQNVKAMGTKASIMFKSPNYDGSLKGQAATKSNPGVVDPGVPGIKAIQAYMHFRLDDGSIRQKAFQRDYIYYGITPEEKTGSLNRSVSEYISFIEVDPNAYFKISDQIRTGRPSDDPFIEHYETSQKKSALSENELLDRMWTKGSYDFRFEIITSTKENPQIIYIPLKPNQLWNFNIEYTRIHSTAFRHSKHTYKIDPYKFTSKRVYLNEKNISFGKWDLSEESIYRYVNIMEEDESIESTYSDTYESVRVKADKFNGDVKLTVGLGEGKSISGGASSEVTNSNTTKESKTITIIRKEKSDPLGSIRIYFYDPIIDDLYMQLRHCEMHTYNTGIVTFAISVK